MPDDEQPDMAVPREDWRRSEAHAQSRYFCGKCGSEFSDPEDLYDHLDEVHANERDRSD